MTARRQSSTTSLSKFARASSPGSQNRSLDFCNAFWGVADGGVEVLFARMRGASRTIDELRNYWKERAAIEEDYAKRLSKLAKQTLGRDEIGELRNSLDTLRLETDNQAGYHLELTRQIRTLLEGPTSAFYAKQQQHKKVFQAAIEKDFKAKQTQESYVTRAREKYEADCLRINSYTAQSTLVQGKDLEKIHLKLERAQQTVQANERDFANFAKALGLTAHKWEQDWKAFCDSCQDMEEDRLNFMKDTMWAYANAVSTVCVADDESCEKMRLALEQTEPEQDMENFVRDYGTGNLIPDPPAFVNYTTPDAVPSSSSRPTTHPAQFLRSSQRQATRAIPPEEEEPTVNTAGVGAGGRRSDPQPDASLHRSQTRTSSRGGSTPAQQQPNGSSTNGYQPPPSQSITRRPTSTAPPQNYRPLQDPNAETIDPTAETFIKVGLNAYKVDLSKDPQQQGPGPSRTSPPSTQSGRADFDPLAQQMEDLKRAASGAGNMNRNDGWKSQQEPRAGGSTSRKGTMDSSAGPSSLTLPSSSTGKSIAGSSQVIRDFRNSAEIVVGAHPSASRPPSPNPPTAKFMAPRTPSPSNALEQRVIADYHQSLPGEGKSPSRSNSRQGSYAGGAPGHQTHAHSQSQGQNLARPISQMGHVGVGAHGRSTSPQPMSRSASPVGNHNNYMNPPAGGPGTSGMGSMRTTSPNSVGIALDTTGRVAQDNMADVYRQPPQQYQQGQASRQGYPPQNNSNSVMSGAPTGYIGPPAGYQAPPSQLGYMAPQYNQSGQQVYPTQQVYQPQPAYGAGLDRGGGSYQASSAHQVHHQQLQQPPQQQQQLTYPGTAVTRTPSPQPPLTQMANGPPPTGQTTEDGRGILFYVKALYDYSATIEEEFDFQAGDIIAVTATPEDGWWSGELLDEARRQPGRHVFPSNFVCLF